MKLYINDVPLIGNEWKHANDFSNLQVYWDSVSGLYYTLIIYDLDAIKAPYIHLLINNILGNDIANGDKVFSFEKPNPPLNSGPHKYVIALFGQNNRVPNGNRLNRASFPLNQYILQNNLSLIANETLIVDPSDKAFHLYNDDPPFTFNPNHPIIRGDSNLTDGEQKYCSCVIDVAAKEPSRCNLERAYFEKRDGRTCANPWAVCSKSVGHSNRNCSSNYNYDQMTDIQLEAFSNLHNIDVPSPYNRQYLLNAIKTKFRL